MIKKITGNPTQGWKIKFHAIPCAKLQKIWADLRLCIISLACAADVIATSAKQRRNPCSGPSTDSTNYLKCVSNLPSTWFVNWRQFFATGQSWRVLKSWYSGGDPEQGFQCYFSKDCVSAVKFIMFLIPVNAREFIRKETWETIRGWQNESQLFVKQNVSQALISVITNNKYQLWKTVSLTSVQTSPMQSVSLFFKFVHPCFLLYLLCHLYPILTSWAVIFDSLYFVAVPLVWILVRLRKDVFERRTSTGSGLFSFLDGDFAQIFGQIASIIVKTLRNTNLVASSYFKMKNTSFLVEVRRSKTPLLKVAEHCFGSLWVYVICQIMARERLQLTSWNLASEKYTDERFWLTGNIGRFRSFHGNMNDWIQP